MSACPRTLFDRIVLIDRAPLLVSGSRVPFNAPSSLNAPMTGRLIPLVVSAR